MMSRALLQAILAGAASLLWGCPSAATREPDPAPVIRGGEFARLLDLEEKGRHLEALESYETLASDPARSETDRVRAVLRIARCQEELGRFDASRKAFEAILGHPGILSDEDHLPPPGVLGIHYRLRAEEGLARVGGSPPVVYASLARTGTPPQKLVAIRSLGRLKSARGRSALRLVAQDAEAEPDLREAAREALKAVEESTRDGE